jgi:hypothetical protein
MTGSDVCVAHDATDRGGRFQRGKPARAALNQIAIGQGARAQIAIGQGARA